MEPPPAPRTDLPDRQPMTGLARLAWLGALALALSTFAWWTMLASYPETQLGDGPQYFKMLESAKWTILRYHEFPGWNPYECGGLPLWDNPQAFIAAPLAWLTFIIGTGHTMEVWYVVHSALGFVSMWLLLREDLRLGRIACFIGSAMWAFNGFHQQHYGHGHFTFVPFEYFPLALFLWRRAEQDLRYAVGMGLLVAWMMYEGAVYPLPHLVVMLALETAFRVRSLARCAAITKAGVVVVAVGFLVCACRFIPVIHQLRIHHRTIAFDVDHITWTTLRQMFLAHEHDPSWVHGQRWEWHEYGAYIGPFLLVFALAGVFSAGLSYPWLLAILVFFFLMMLGEFATWAPWTVLHHYVFPFKEMRAASRFRLEVVLAFSAFAAIAIDELPRRVRRLRRFRVLPGHVRAGMVLLALLGVGDMLGVGLTRFPTKWAGRPSQPSTPSRHLYLGGSNLAAFIDRPQQNRGGTHCWDEWGFEKGAPFWVGDVPQVRAANPELASVSASRRTTNSFSFLVDAREPTRVLMNTSYDDGWHTTVGTVLRDNHLLAVDVPAGKYTVRVHYWPYGLTAGLIVSPVSILLVIGYYVWEARRRKRRNEVQVKPEQDGAHEGAVNA